MRRGLLLGRVGGEVMKQYTKEKSIWEHISWVCTISLVFLFIILLVNTFVSIHLGIDIVSGTPSLGYSGLTLGVIMIVSNCIDGLTVGCVDNTTEGWIK